MHWWEKWPGRYDYELQALKDANIPYERVDRAFRDGVLQLVITPTVHGQPRKLVATFPDLYPYFRFEVQAFGENLPYHQHPHGRNLCLLGRATENWDPAFTLAKLVTEKLPDVFAAALAKDEEAAAPLEEHQAEPYSEYYPYGRALLLVDGDWVVPKEVRAGVLKIGLSPHRPAPGGPELRGAVLEVAAGRGETLVGARSAIKSLYGAQTVVGRWARVDAPIQEFDPGKFIAALQKHDPAAAQAPENAFGGGKLQVWGALFPEEVGYRRRGEGWTFACRHRKAADLLRGLGPASPLGRGGR